MRISDWSSDVCSSDLSILADDEQAVVLGELASRIKATGRLIETPFAFVLTVRDGKIVRYRMLDDSHGVAVEASGQSARPEERRVGNECVRTCRVRLSATH